MTKDLWLPKGYELADGSIMRSLLFSGDDWQILTTNGSSNILLVCPELVQKWNDNGFLSETLFGEIKFGTDSFKTLNSHKKYSLSPVENEKPPDTKVDAVSFSFALKESRKLAIDVSFHDAIYVEQYSRLLPTWTLTPYVDDKMVLGTWLTGGVVISIDSFRRLSCLMGWMPSCDLVEIVETAGFNVPTDVSLLSKRKPVSRSKTDKKDTIADVNIEPDEQSEFFHNILERKVFCLPGRSHLEVFFNEHVVDIIYNAEKYKVLGIDFPSAIVLHGPPGCGKTFAVDRLVEFIDWPNYSIDSNSVSSPYIHETSKKISEVFDKAIDNAPSVLVIDEMESFLSDRQFGGGTGLHHVEEVAEFLRRIPEAISNKVLIIAMTNMIDMIDPAILRRGRFDHIIKVRMPDKKEVRSLLDSLLSKLPKAENLNVDIILEDLTGKALSDSAFVVREAARIAAKEGKSQLDQNSINAALKSLPKTNKNRPVGFV